MSVYILKGGKTGQYRLVGVLSTSGDNKMSKMLLHTHCLDDPSNYLFVNKVSNVTVLPVDRDRCCPLLRRFVPTHTRETRRRL